MEADVAKPLELAPSGCEVAVYLFGGMRIQTSAGKPIILSGRKGPALIAYLALCPGMMASREKLADLLWSDLDRDHARNRLRQVMVGIRRELKQFSPGLFIATNDAIGLNTQVVQVDVVRFSELFRVANLTERKAAAALYVGPFLDGFFADSDHFEDWAARTREKFNSDVTYLLEYLAQQNNREEALSYANRLLSIDPTREASHRLKMKLLIQQGEADQALKQYEICKVALKQGLGVAPSLETQRLHNSIHGQVAATSPTLISSLMTPRYYYEKCSIAILPFTLIDDASEVRHLSHRLTDGIVSALCHQTEITVVQNASKFRSVARAIDLCSFASETQVQYILKGSLWREKDTIRIFVSLIDAFSGLTVWKGDHKTTNDGLGEPLNTIVEAVANATQSEALLKDWGGAETIPRGDPRAWNTAGRALVNMHQQTRSSIVEAIRLSRQALAFEPTNPRALRALSVSISSAIAQVILPESRENIDEALRYARAAVETCPYDEHSRFTLTWALINAGLHDDAFRQISLAVDINPSYSVGVDELGERFAAMGRHDEAVKTLHHGLALSPRDPANFWRHHGIAVAHFSVGEDKEALNAARQVADLRPDFLRNALLWAAAAAAAGEDDEANRAARHCESLSPSLSVSLISPGAMSRFIRQEHHQRLKAMLRKAGLKA